MANGDEFYEATEHASEAAGLAAASATIRPLGRAHEDRTRQARSPTAQRFFLERGGKRRGVPLADKKSVGLFALLVDGVEHGGKSPSFIGIRIDFV